MGTALVKSTVIANVAPAGSAVSSETISSSSACSNVSVAIVAGDTGDARPGGVERDLVRGVAEMPRHCDVARERHRRGVVRERHVVLLDVDVGRAQPRITAIAGRRRARQRAGHARRCGSCRRRRWSAARRELWWIGVDGGSVSRVVGSVRLGRAVGGDSDRLVGRGTRRQQQRAGGGDHCQRPDPAKRRGIRCGHGRTLPNGRLSHAAAIPARYLQSLLKIVKHRGRRTDDTSVIEQTEYDIRDHAAASSRRRLPLASGLLAAVIGAAILVVPDCIQPRQAVADDDWLGVVNIYRAMSGVDPVTANADWSAQDQAHSCYMLQNGITHDEVPGNPGYTSGGDIAGNSGNVAVSSSVSASARNHIDLWMTGPFHAIGILRHNLRYRGLRHVHLEQYSDALALGRNARRAPWARFHAAPDRRRSSSPATVRRCPSTRS